MNQAVAPKRKHVGLRVAPTSERLCPLPRTTEIEHRLTQGDHLAVGDPTEDGRHLVRGHRDHQLVQQCHPLGDAPLQDQPVSAAEPREHRRVGIGEALGDLPRIDEARVHACVSLEQARQGGQHLKPGLLDALAAALLQQPATAGDPTHRRRQVAPEEKAQRLPEGAARRALSFAAARPQLVGGDPGLVASLVPSEHVSGNRQTLEILSVQLPLATSRRQLVESVTPHPTLERAAGPVRSIGHGHRPTIDQAYGWLLRSAAIRCFQTGGP